jgi:phage repressor protein C with HTH and peptisase S24 domain
MSNLGNKKTMSSNLRRLLEPTGMNVKQFAKELNFKYTTVLDWFNANRYPRIDKIEIMAHYFGVSKSDLVEDYDPVKEKQSENKKIIDNIFNVLHEPRQQKVLDYAENQLEKQMAESNKIMEFADYQAKNTELFPYDVQEKLSAGTGYSYDGLGSSDTVYYDKELDYDLASYIWGDSMEPKYENGEVALIKITGFDYDGEIYAIDWDGQSYIKKVYKEKDGLRLVSLNKKYSDKFAPFSEEPRVIGKVIHSFMPIEM